jgi:hypothetical protein
MRYRIPEKLLLQQLRGAPPALLLIFYAVFNCEISPHSPLMLNVCDAGLQRAMRESCRNTISGIHLVRALD